MHPKNENTIADYLESQQGSEEDCFDLVDHSIDDHKTPRTVLNVAGCRSAD